MRSHRGFTLIELMVAVALGLMATVVIAQVFLQSEGNKRSTTEGADAQVAGALALFTMQRDIEMAGYGMADLAQGLGCPVVGTYDGTSVPGFQGAADPLVPVRITAGASDSASDTISIWSSSKQNFSIPMKLSEAHDSTSPDFVVSSTMGVAVGDLLVAIPTDWTAANCVVMAATTSSLSSSTNITHGASSLWNSGVTTTLPAGSTLLNLGPMPLRRTYSVNATNWSLQVADFQANSPSRSANNLFPQIVLLKALYGKATTAGGVVARYEAASPVSDEEWKTVGSVRLVVVARSGQYEKEAVTDAFPEWEVGPLVSGAVACSGEAGRLCLKLDVSASGSANVLDPKGVSAPAWKHYRYKVFDTVVPVRNMLWMSGPA